MHWGGYGGSGVIMIPEIGVSFSIVPNKFYGGFDDGARGPDMLTALVGSIMAATI